MEGDALVADLRDELAVEDVEPLVLMGVDVTGWAAFFVVGMLDGEEGSLGVLGEDFKGEGAVGHVVHVACAVLMVGDWVGG